MARSRFSILFLLLGLFFALVSCNEVETRDLDIDSDVLDHGELSSFQIMEAWYLAKDNTQTYHGEVQVVSGVPEIPETIMTVHGDRTNAETPVDFGLYNKVIFNAGESSTGDHIMLQPIFVDNKELSPVTTALYIFLRENFFDGTENLKVSYTQWKQMLITLGVYCNDCRFKKVHEVISVIQSRENLRDELFSILEPTNAGLRYLAKNKRDWAVYFHGASKRLVSKTADLEPVVETDTINLFAHFVHPTDFTKLLKVSEWKKILGGAELASYTDEALELYMDHTSSGSYIFQGSYSSSEINTFSVIFNQLVGNTNRSPMLTLIPSYSLQENHESSLDLNAYKVDPDGDTTLNILLDSAPAGCFINAGVLTWNPLGTQLGSQDIKIRVEDSESLSSQVYTIEASVAADTLPTFIGLSDPYNVVEGTEGAIALPTVDADGDRLVVTVVATSVSGLLTGSPTGAAWGSSPMSQAGVDGSQIFSFFYLPSFREVYDDNDAVDDENRTVSVEFSLSYDTSVAGIRNFGTVSQAINVLIDNFDDPPVWSGASANQTIVDGNAFSFPLGASIVDDHQDHNPTPFANLTYSRTVLTSGCDFLSIDPSSGVISGTVTFVAPEVCEFTVEATDSNGLATSSSTIAYSVTNVNTLPNIVGTVPAQAATENEEFQLNMMTYFEDADFTAGDAQELLAFTCTNCVALGIDDLEINSTGNLSWTPNFLDAGTYANVSIEMTDKHMREASLPGIVQTFDITVAQSASPVVLTFATTDFVMSEGGSLAMSFDVSQFSPEAIDIYDYDVIVDCFDCRGGFSTLGAGDETGNSGTSKVINVNFEADFTDGDAELAAFKVWGLRASVVHKLDSTVIAKRNFSVRVDNVNQLPTALGLNGDTGTGAFNFSINLANPGNRFKEVAINLVLVDLDGANDSYSYAFEDTTNFPPFGSLNASTGVWTYIPVACPAGGGQTASRSFRVSGADASGAKIIRQIDLSVLDTVPNAACP